MAFFISHFSLSPHRFLTYLLPTAAMALCAATPVPSFLFNPPTQKITVFEPVDECVEGTLRSSYERSGVCFGGFRSAKHLEEPRLRALPSPKRLRADTSACRHGLQPVGAPLRNNERSLINSALEKGFSRRFTGYLLLSSSSWHLKRPRSPLM